LFAPLHRKWRFFRAIHSLASARMVGRGPYWVGDGGRHTPPEVVQKTQETKVADVARRVLLQSFAPASVVTDMKGTVLYVHGDTGTYLRPAPGEATLNVVDLAREGLKAALREAIHAASQGTATAERELTVTTDGQNECVDVT